VAPPGPPPPAGRKTRRAADLDFPVGEIAPVLSRGVWSGGSYDVPEITTPVLSQFWGDGSRTARLKTGAVSRLEVVHPQRAEFFALPGASRLYPAGFLMRVHLVTQFTSQVFPPSSENACSDWAMSGVTPQSEKRTKTDLPLIGS
jgi:hypothetical protein